MLDCKNISLKIEIFLSSGIKKTNKNLVISENNSFLVKLKNTSQTLYDTLQKNVI